MFFASCTANRALNLLRASSLEFNTSFFLEAGALSRCLRRAVNGAEWRSTRPGTVWWDAMRGGVSFISAALIYMLYRRWKLFDIEHIITTFATARKLYQGMPQLGLALTIYL